MTSLAELQQRLWQLITAPDGVDAALAASGDADAAALAAWVVDAPPLDPARRVGVYASAYFQRIHDVLAEDFDLLAALLGEAGFHDLITAYLIAHPSRSFSLRFVGDTLPGYLASADAAAPFRRRWPWAADLAKLEWQLGLAFDAADAEPLDRGGFAHAAPERWDPVQIRFHPSVALVETGWPVASLLASRLDGDPLHAPTDPQYECTCVWRVGGRVRQRQCEADETLLLRAALAGVPFGDVCELAAQTGGEAEAAALAAALLGRWVDAGLVVGVEAGAAEPRRGT